MVNVVSRPSGLKQHNFLERRVLIRSCDIIQGGENRKLGGGWEEEENVYKHLFSAEKTKISRLYTAGW